MPNFDKLYKEIIKQKCHVKISGNSTWNYI